jgi:hypothetical protein
MTGSISRKDGDMEQDEVTEQQDEITMKRTENQGELTEVASMIRPLPDNVVPSDEFLRRMRLRLLRLEGKTSQSSGNQAA